MGGIIGKDCRVPRVWWIRHVDVALCASDLLGPSPDGADSRPLITCVSQPETGQPRDITRLSGSGRWRH